MAGWRSGSWPAIQHNSARVRRHHQSTVLANVNTHIVHTMTCQFSQKYIMRDTCSYEEVLKPLGFVITCIQDNDVAVKPRQGMEKIARWKRMAKPNQSGFSRVTLSTRFQRPQYAMKLSTSEMKTYTHYMEDSSSVLCVVIGNTVRYMFINISYMYCAKQFSAVSRCLLHSWQF